MKMNLERSFFAEIKVKMRNAKTVFFVAVAFATLLAVTGCGQKRGQQPSLEGVTQSITFSGYPMDAKGQTISWFGTTGYLPPNAQFASASDSPFHIYLQEMLGVNIAWQFPLTGADGNQALNLALASRDIPMVIFSTGLMTQSQLLIEEGTIYDLTPYLEKWSPAYWKLLQSNPEYDKAMKTDSGKYYGYGFFREDGGWNETYLGPVINKTWLDELGLPMPKTISDWDRTLRAFKERYGATLSFDWGLGTYGGIGGAFGAHAFGSFYGLYIDENRKVQIANIQPEYKNHLEQLITWWQDGLIDPDILSILTATQARSNALNKKMGISITTMGQLSNWIQDARANNNGAEWIGLQYPTGDDGTLVSIPGGSGIGVSVAVITTSTPPEQLELVMRALDYSYTDEGFLYWNFGKQGNSWDFDSQGNPALLPLVADDPNGVSAVMDKYAGSVWSGNTVQATAMIHMKNTPEAVAANDLWFWPNEAITAHDKIPSGLTFTSEEAIRSAELATTISTFVGESTSLFITGSSSLDTWDDYVARVKSLGAEELLSIYQAAYDRYLAR